MKKEKLFTFKELMTKYSKDELSDIQRRMWDAESIMKSQRNLNRPGFLRNFSDFSANKLMQTVLTGAIIISASAIVSKNLKITVSVKGEREE